MNNLSFGSGNPIAFHAYTRGDFDLESGNSRRSFRKPKNSQFIAPIRMIRSISNRIYYFYKLHPFAVFLTSLSIGITVLVVLSLYERKLRMMDFRRNGDLGVSSDSYPLPNLRNLVMVAGHSVYTGTSCDKFDSEDSWFLEPYQKNPGQAATFLAHIQVGVESAAKDEGALLLFSGGETRKGGGPRSEAQSYWFVAESKSWFGHKDSVRDRALTEEHARDSFENLLFSICRFHELTGSYPQNITVISCDFERERFAQLHRPAIGFPEGSFFYVGTPAAPGAQVASENGEALARAQFQEDPYGCFGTLHRKRLIRDPFHRFVPYPNSCPELKGLFSYCGPVPFPESLPWTIK